MNMKQIRELMALVKENDLTAFELTEGDTHIVMKRELCAPAPACAPVYAPAVPAAPASAVAEELGVNFADAAEIKSPMPGIFYAAPSPDAEPYVRVGSRVKKGDVVCIIEAMKLMNEITADQDGEILDVCLENGAVVEYGQTLFKII